MISKSVLFRPSALDLSSENKIRKYYMYDYFLQNSQTHGKTSEEGHSKQNKDPRNFCFCCFLETLTLFEKFGELIGVPNTARGR